MPTARHVFVACALAIATPIVLAQEEEVRKAGSDAIALARAGRFAEAEARLSRAPTPTPKERSIALFHLGWIKMRQADAGSAGAAAAREQAIAAYEGVLRETPGNPQAIQNLVLALDAAGRPEESTRRLEAAVDEPRSRAKRSDTTLVALLMDRYIARRQWEAAWRVGSRAVLANWRALQIHERLLLCREGAGRDFLGYLRDARTRGPAAIAQQGALAVFLDRWRTDPNMAAEALVIWVEASVDQGAFGPAELDAIRSATPEDGGLRAALSELWALTRVSARGSETEVKKAAWWGAALDRKHVASALVRNRGDTAERERRQSDAEMFYRAAIAMAPEAKDHLEDPVRKDERMARLEASAALARLYHRFRDLDPDRSKTDALSTALFQSKMKMYEEDNVAGMRQFHETLGVIFYDEGRWESAQFQLRRTVDTEEQLARSTGKRAKPLPHLERMRAEALVKLDRYDEAAASVAAASKGFIALRQPEQVAATVGLIKDVNRLSEPRRQDIQVLQRFSLESSKVLQGDRDTQIKAIQEIEKMSNEAQRGATIDAKWLGTAVRVVADRADDTPKARVAKPEEKARWDQEKARLLRTYSPPDREDEDDIKSPVPRPR